MPRKNAHGIRGLASPIPWLFVRLHLQAIQELVESCEQVDDGHEFYYPLVVESQLPHRGSMHLNSVATPGYG